MVNALQIHSGIPECNVMFSVTRSRHWSSLTHHTLSSNPKPGWPWGPESGKASWRWLIATLYRIPHESLNCTFICFLVLSISIHPFFFFLITNPIYISYLSPSMSSPLFSSSSTIMGTFTSAIKRQLKKKRGIRLWPVEGQPPLLRHLVGSQQ